MQHRVVRSVVLFMTMSGAALAAQEAPKPRSAAIDSLYREVGAQGGRRVAATLHVEGSRFAESDLNALGYRLLAERRAADAVAIFEINIALHPSSANAYDSMGDGYVAADRRADAARVFDRAFVLDQKFTRSRDYAARLRDPVRAERWTPIQGDARVIMDTVRVTSGGDTYTAYMARPRAPGKHPAVIVLHANRLTEPYIASATQMLARAGFVALAVDLYHFSPGNETWESANRVPSDTVSAVIAREFREPRMLDNVQSALDYLHKQSFTAPGGVGLLGFCGSGWNALIASAQLDGIGAVVAFYAPVTLSDAQHRSPMELAQWMHAPIQYHRALTDRFVSVPDADRFVARLRELHTPIDMYDYQAGHGFFAWNRDGAFAENAAAEAWTRIVPFLQKNLGHPVPRTEHAPIAPKQVGSASTSHLVLHEVAHRH